MEEFLARFETFASDVSGHYALGDEELLRMRAALDRLQSQIDAVVVSLEGLE